MPIPAPPVGGNRAVVERADLYFADDDYLVWPQPYNPSLPHLPFIRRRESDVLNLKRNFLWSLPERSDFHVLDSRSYTGLGHFHGSKFRQLQTFHEHLVVTMQKNENHLPAKNTEQDLHARILITESVAMLQRLDSLPMGFRSMCRTVRATQRVLLELEAYIDYYLAYYPASIDISNQPQSSFPRIGSILSQIPDLQRFQRLNIPHWLILPYERILSCRVSEVTTMLFPEQVGLSIEAISAIALPIFVGPATDRKKYEAIRHYGNACIRFADPFHCKSLPEPIASPTGPVRTSGSGHRALTHKQRMKLFTSSRKTAN